jgi:hypothetical protein
MQIPKEINSAKGQTLAVSEEHNAQESRQGSDNSRRKQGVKLGARTPAADHR